MVLCAKIKKVDAEKTKQKLIEKNVIDYGYYPKRDDEYVYFALKQKIPEIEVANINLKQKSEKFGTLKEILNKKLTENELKKLVTSYDVIGDIAVLDIPQELESKTEMIAETLLKRQKKIKVIAKRDGAFSGLYRIRKITPVAGEKRTTTIHKESGCKFYLDLNKTYFSPRLSHERERIEKQINENEKILVLFAGVGPYAIVIAKKHPDVEIIAIELNPDAVEMMKENIKINKISNIMPICADVNEELLKKEYKNWADRIIMPLPKDAEHFLDVTFKAIKKGGIVHFYHFTPVEKGYKEAEKIISDAAKRNNRTIEIKNEKIVRPFSSKTVQVVIDFKVN